MLKDSHNNYILGISSNKHQSSLCLIKDRNIIAIHQQKFKNSLKNNNIFFDFTSLKNILLEAKISLMDIDHIVYFDYPKNKFTTILKGILFNKIKGFKDFIFNDFEQIISVFLTRRNLKKQLIKIEIALQSTNKKSPNLIKINRAISSKICFSEANHAIMFGCFFASAVKESAILCLNDSATQARTSIGWCSSNKIKFLQEIDFPHSLLKFKNAIENFINNEIIIESSFTARKDMNLEIGNLLRKMIDIKKDASFHFDLSYFSISKQEMIVNKKFINLFSPIITKFNCRETLLIQVKNALEDLILEIAIKLLKQIKKISKSKNLIVYNDKLITLPMLNKIREMQIFEQIIFVQYNGVSLQALGCSLLTYYQNFNQARQISASNLSLIFSSYDFSNNKIKETLKTIQSKYLQFSDEMQIVDLIAQNLSLGKKIAWHRGIVDLNCFGINSPMILFSLNLLSNNSAQIGDFYKKNNFQNQLIGIIFWRENILDYFIGDFLSLLNDFKDKKFDDNYFNDIRLNANHSKKTSRNQQNNNFQNHLFYLQSKSAKADLTFYNMVEKFYQLKKIKFIFTLPLSKNSDCFDVDIVEANQIFKKNEIDILLIKNFALFKEDQDDNELN